jgi:hypothetical protein
MKTGRLDAAATQRLPLMFASRAVLTAAVLLLMFAQTRADASIITWDFEAVVGRAENIASASSGDALRARLYFDSDASFEPSPYAPDSVGVYYTSGSFEFSLDSPLPFTRTLPTQPLRIAVSNNIDSAHPRIPPRFDEVNIRSLSDAPRFELWMTLYFTPPAAGFTDTVAIPLFPPAVIDTCSIRNSCPDYASLAYWLLYRETGGIEIFANITKTSAAEPAAAALIAIGLAAGLRSCRRVSVRVRDRPVDFG